MSSNNAMPERPGLIITRQTGDSIKITLGDLEVWIGVGPITAVISGVSTPIKGRVKLKIVAPPDVQIDRTERLGGDYGAPAARGE